MYDDGMHKLYENDHRMDLYVCVRALNMGYFRHQCSVQSIHSISTTFTSSDGWITFETPSESKTIISLLVFKSDED